MSHSQDASFFDYKRPWSKYKDHILSYYLTPYLAHVARRRTPIVIADFFAGPGTFEDGTDGSPLIILKALSKVQSIRCRAILNEHDPDLFRRLQQNTNTYSSIADLRNSDCIELIDELASVAKTSTVFLYLDPFSLGGLNLGRLSSIYSRIHQSVEVLFVFMADAFLRFAKACLANEGNLSEDILTHLTDTDDQLNVAISREPNLAALIKTVATSRRSLDEFAGGDYWRECLHAGSRYKDDLHSFVDAYKSQMRRWFKVVCSYDIYAQPHDSIPKYTVLFASRFPKALDLINDAMADARERQEKEWATDTLFAEGEMYTSRDASLVAPKLAALAEQPIPWEALRWRFIELDAGACRCREINDAIKYALRAGMLRGASGTKIEKNALLTRRP